MRRDDAHGQPPGHVRKLVTELAEAVYDNVVQHVGVFGKAREVRRSAPCRGARDALRAVGPRRAGARAVHCAGYP